MLKPIKDFAGWMNKIYRQTSIQLVISASFTVVALIGMIFMGVTLTMRFSTSTDHTAEINSQRVIEQVNLNLDAYLRNMMRISDSMYYRVLKNTDLAKKSPDEGMALLYGTYRDVLVGISVFEQDGSLVSATPLNTIKPWVEPQKQKWFTAAEERIENLHFSTPHVQNLFIDPDNRYNWVVSLSRQVELTRNGMTQGGVLLVDMNFGGIEQIFKDSGLNKTGYVYLINGDGEIIYHPRQQLIYSKLVQENNLTAALYEDGSHRETFQNASRLVTVRTMGYTGWKIVGVTPLEFIASDFAQIRIFVIFILMFSIFLMIFANIFVSSRISVPIKNLDNVVRQLEAGADSLTVPEGGCYEVQHLGQSIRSMVDTMHQLMKDVVRQQEYKRKSELDVLQAQINPHFLYNTLDSIIWMIENESYNEAIVMVTSLARFFRLSLSGGRSIITVAEELEHATHYLTIQKMRYKNKFEVEINVGEGVKNLSVIKLIVQPILENAIYHGMEFMDGDGQILINAYCEGEDLLIDVTDNGLGMPPEKVKTLLGEYVPNKKGSGIGVRNVNERIRLAFGERYGLEVQSVPDEGTRVRIRLPIIEYKDNSNSSEVRQ